MTAIGRLLASALAMTALSACSIFGGDDDEELEPTPLLDFDQTLAIDRLWSGKVGKGTEFLRLSLTPAGDGARVYVASYNGTVSALNPDNGRSIWRVELDTELTAGPGLGEGLVVVADQEGIVISLNAEDGSEMWRSDIEGESVSVPLIKNDIVVVASIDGILRGLSAFDGSVRWAIEQPLPALTLRGSSAPVIVGTTVVAGFDNGRLIAASLDDGTTEWEAMLSPPSGRSDLERLADIDGVIATVGQDVYAAGYQGRVAAMAAESGQVLWSREVSSYAGIGADWENVYTVTDDGELIAMSRRNGGDEWRQVTLIRREPTAPVPFDTAVAVGDFEGYVHLFDSQDGTPVARVRVGKGMISGAPVVIAGRLYVQNESGEVAAFSVRQPERPADDADEVDDADIDSAEDT